MTEITLKIQTPSVPNFVFVEFPQTDKSKDKPSLSVGELSDEQIESLVKDWRIKLFQNANRQRMQAKEAK